VVRLASHDDISPRVSAVVWLPRRGFGDRGDQRPRCHKWRSLHVWRLRLRTGTLGLRD